MCALELTERRARATSSQFIKESLLAWKRRTACKGDRVMARRRVLVVDDDRNIVQLVRMYLEKDGYQVGVAYDGEEALAIARMFKPDLVVLDLMLPGLDGLEVCRQIR